MTTVAVQTVRTFPANAAVAKNLRVALSAGNIAAAGITDTEIGILEEAILANETKGAVRLSATNESVRVTAAGAVTQYAEVYAAAGGKISATPSGTRWGIALEAASGDGSVVEVLRLPGSGEENAIVAEEITFTEDGDTTYTGDVNVPAGAVVIDVIIHAVALWDDGTSASLNVGDVADPNGIYAGVNLKATDLAAGESISFGLTGGKEGADLDGGETAGDHARRRYLATARVISGVVVTGGQNGTAGRTRMIVLYTVPNSVAATGV